MKEDPAVSTTAAPDRFTSLPDEPALAATVVALEEHGFSVEVADDLDAARAAVLARIPDGSSVMTNTSVTLAETGIADAINDAGSRWESARNKMLALDFATQAQEMKAIGGQPDCALGSVHAVTADGTLVIASASGSQLSSYAWGAANVIFVIGAQKLVPPWRQRISGSISTACRWRTPARRPPTGSAARWVRSSRSTRSCPAVSTSSSSGGRSASDDLADSSRSHIALHGARHGHETGLQTRACSRSEVSVFRSGSCIMAVMVMRLSARADYALRAAIELAAAQGGHVTAEQLAQAQNAPGKFLETILTHLRRSNIVRSQRGPDGGFWLARAPSEISLADIIRAIDGQLLGVRGERPENVSYPGAAAPLQRVWIALRANERAVLESVTLADIVSGELPPAVAALTDSPGAWV